MLTKATAEGADIARIFANANSMVPARAHEQMLTLSITEGRISMAGSDTYAAGIDYCEATTEGLPTMVGLARADSLELESMARSAKKELVQLIISPGGTMGERYLTMVLPHPDDSDDDTEPPQKVCAATDPQTERWKFLVLLMSRELSEDPPELMAVDPALMARFAKVRAEPDRVMDMWFRDSESAVLTRIGPTFRGLFMPLKRARASAFSPQGLWTSCESCGRAIA